MQLIFPEGYRYDCGSCTKCCRTVWNVHVDPRAYKKVVGSPLYDRMKAEHGDDPIKMAEIKGEKTALAMVNKGGCIFLSADRKCSIHREMGVDAKPLGCREFPFLPVPTPDGVVVGLSFYCSAVQAGHGRSVEAHAEEVAGFLKEYNYDRVGFEPIALDTRHAITWDALKGLEATAREWIAADLHQGVWDLAMRIAQAVHRLSEAPDGTISDETWHRVLAETTRIQPDEILAQVERMFLYGVMGVLESSTPDECKRNGEALFSRGTLRSGSFGKDIDLAQFDDFRGRFDARWSLAEFRRYFEQLLFRKFLAQKRPLMDNAAAFYLALPLLECYRDLSAYGSGKLQPDIQDVRNAFDVVERGFVMHANSMDPFFAELARTHLKLLTL